MKDSPWNDSLINMHARHLDVDRVHHRHYRQIGVLAKPSVVNPTQGPD